MNYRATDSALDRLKYHASTATHPVLKKDLKDAVDEFSRTVDYDDLVFELFQLAEEIVPGYGYPIHRSACRWDDPEEGARDYIRRYPKPQAYMNAIRSHLAKKNTGTPVGVPTHFHARGRPRKRRWWHGDWVSGGSGLG